MILLILALVSSAAAVDRDPRCVQYARGAEAVTIPHRDDCTKFHICGVQGRALEMDCPPGLYFSPTDGVCSFDRSGCTGSVNIVKPSKPVINTQNNNVIVVVPEIQNVDKLTLLEWICSNQPNGVTLPVVEDCFSYAVCMHNKPIILACQAGLAYDHQNRKCDFKEKVSCVSSRLPQPIEPVDVPRVHEYQPIVALPEKPSLTRPEILTPVEQIPDTPMLPSEPIVPQQPILPPRMPIITIPEFPVLAPVDMNADNEMRPYMQPLGLNDPRCNGQNDPNFPRMMPHTRDCSKYLVCVGRMAVEKSCPQNQHWSVENNYCDFIYRANCRL